MKILVTGAAGQLGKALQRVIPRLLPDVETIFADRHALDLLDGDEVMRRVERGEFTHIVNCAGYTAVDKAEEEKAACTAANIDAAANIAAAAYAFGAKLIHISSDYVFDGRQWRPYIEGDKVNPLSHYGTTKRRSETRVLAALPEAIIVRTQWLYGLGGKNFVETMISRAEKSQPGEAISVVADQTGAPTNADDLAEALVCMIKSRQWVPGIYHYANEGTATWYDFAMAIFRIAGIKANVKPIATEDYPTAATRPHYTVLDRRKIKATYSISIPHWEESLTRYLKERKAFAQGGMK